MNNNKFPAQDLSCFTPFINLERLFIVNNPFYGSLKPLRDFTYLKEIGIANTDVDSGLEYLPENFFNFNATASDLGWTGAYFKRELYCTGKLAEQLKDYKIENDPLRNYDWQAWKRDNQKLINKAREQAKQEELIEIVEWDILARETKDYMKNSGVIFIKKPTIVDEMKCHLEFKLKVLIFCLILSFLCGLIKI
ncbi:hypothetical protein RhiirA5_416144 [Rhizophagus irregularis]|uniref:Uncharacterized protein n=1 Tax=Rhizophagus irregularis TaxID=588596 RepID=A0A2N0SJN9_9GLOM|nr:hypothetical protein RhiirA5_416144 [Rhizophagus irregularis]PKC75770.1 hypothetical protein RhiirA1_448391 [Rhizophagus irregularis]CAB4482938.1 unnamed protein product [Rhizophagus irregularis]CAB5215927.1 unnamed protein product [Rhizophagus irregularis]CAB5365440.1 unnamed protein product [Rhizophagus irregularis]